MKKEKETINLELSQEQITKRNFWAAYGDASLFICSECKKEIKEYGFMCENDKSFLLCEECQKKAKMNSPFTCKHSNGEHKHYKFIRIN